MKVGDMVICTCEADIWYKGLLGTVIYFEHFGKMINFCKKGSTAMVLYPNGSVQRLTTGGLEVIIENR